VWVSVGTGSSGHPHHPNHITVVNRPGGQATTRRGYSHMRRLIPTSSANDEWAESVPMLREAYYSQSLESGLAILGCFTPDTPILGIATIADMLGMHRSTTHRYVITLVALGYLEQIASGRKYRLALSATTLGMGTMNSIGLQEHARSFLRDLAQRSGYTVSLATLDGPAIQYVERVPGRRRGRRRAMAIDVGSRLPAHCTAMGKLLLASLPAAPRRVVLSELTLTKTGPKTITSKSRLNQELREIRETDLAVNDQELLRGLIAIAAPVRDITREVVAAVSMTADQSVIDLEALAGKLSPHLISTADRISARLGYRREDESYGSR
jgi:DNA-binding IclR family transcriptional regulator